MSKLFSVVGICTQNGNTKVRYTNDLARRVKVLSNVERSSFIALPNPMTKLEALNFMLTQHDFQSPEDQATIKDTIADRERDARKGEVKVKSSKAKTVEAIDSLTTNNNEASVEDVLSAHSA